MGKRHLLGLGGLLAGLILCLATAGTVRSQRVPAPAPAVGGSINARVAAKTGLKEADVDKALRAYVAELQADLATGKVVEVPRLGVYRVVRVPEHRDLAGGRPATIPAANYVEFVPAPNLVDAANSPNAVPATVVPPFEYHPLTGQTPSNKLPDTRVPSTRVP